MSIPGINSVSTQQTPAVVYMSQVQSLRERPLEASLVGNRQDLERKMDVRRNGFNFLSQLQETFAPVGRFFNRLFSPSSLITSGIEF